MTIGQFIEAGDLIGRGKLSEGYMALGYRARRGLDFPYRDGVWLLQCRALNPPGPWEWCGVLDLSLTALANRPSYVLANSTGYQFRACRANGNGYISAFTEPIRVDIDGAGDAVSPALPTWPVYVRSKAIAAGKFTVSWTYNPYGEGASPTDFEIYEGTTPATIDYGTVLGTETYIPGKTDATPTDHEFTTGVFTDATPHSFAVRARNSEGVDEGNLFATVARNAETAVPTGVAAIHPVSQETR